MRLMRFPGEPAIPGVPLEAIHSLAMLGAVVFVPNEALVMASRMGEVGFPFNDGVATGFISGDCTEEDEEPEAKALGTLRPENWPAACFDTAAAIAPLSLTSFFDFLGI